jgi:predicted nuclease of restriction endonuclease-like (RecB) superfamily
MSRQIQNTSLYDKIAGLLRASGENASPDASHTMVYNYFEIGRMIAEDDQEGENRSRYGKQVLEDLSRKLTQHFGKGFSVVNLRQMRVFYLAYSIQQTKISAELKNPLFTLPWSHYLKLMRIENLDERGFYEIECAKNNWTLKELQSQLDSSLYKKALSLDKQGIHRLHQQGQLMKTPADMLKAENIINNTLYNEIREVIRHAQSKLVKSVNRTMVLTYWEIGRRIVEEEQNGENRAQYGKALIANLAAKLSDEFGKSFDKRNILYMRQFYLNFPKVNAVRSLLSWTHYRLLMKIDNESERQFYIDECVECSWSTRQLERQINSFYYHRLLASHDKKTG